MPIKGQHEGSFPVVKEIFCILSLSMYQYCPLVLRHVTIGRTW